MPEITLDELLQEVKAKEEKMGESPDVTAKINLTATRLEQTARSGSVKILTDYDADGICSAFIMQRTIQSIAPDTHVEVQCNDRRGSYGVSSEIESDGVSKYIVLDMGSNQLQQLQETLGDDVIIIDHHLIEEQINIDAFNYNTRLLNPHSMSYEEGNSADYCATGLAYRLYQQMQERVQEMIHSEKQDNTIAIMAAIGTAADMVDVMDMRSNNRQILKDGVEKINNADEKNIEYPIGYMLATAGIGQDDVTAHDVAFNVGAFLNAASRMSEILQENGAQRMYDAISSGDNPATYQQIDILAEINKDRKAYISELTGTESYRQFLEEQRNSPNNIALYELPQDTPAAFAGLVAGKLAEATDKAIICVTYSSSRECYTGSGRNVASNETGLKDFLDSLDLSDKMQYGGHTDAIGISRLDDIRFLESRLEANINAMERKSGDRLVLKMSPQELSSPETLEKMKAIEPLGTGLKLPPMEIEGKEQYRNGLYVKKNPSWKKVRIKADDTTLNIPDWSYSPVSYPQDSKGNIKILAEVGLNSFNGQSVELTAKFDRSFQQERQKELQHDKPAPKKGAERE
ncbi:hypothetical protein DWX94_00835 [Coprococcus eutactus]|jgi:single-stranded-DNA-specific exonuclease recJ|uniref:DDH domain-containing protein n=1 Tax=Coprococcus eutactus TaxID=33043 RepID=A0A412IW92_9FIRM|nr:hypothetical protein [Coprococcus eutactus]RGS44367.1 hypothetical protein DWX94_00835 [Coprococcus eutactus]